MVVENCFYIDFYDVGSLAEHCVLSTHIWLCTSNSVFLRVVVTNSPQLIKVRDLNGCHDNQTTF